MNRLFGEGIYLLLYPFAPVILFILLRGHNHPGGGFIAGVMAIVVFILVSLSKTTFGGTGLKSIPNPKHLTIPGLCVAILAGFIGLFLQGSLFSSVYFGSVFGISFTSEFIFDIGIFMLVLGAVGRIFYTFLGKHGG